MNVDFNKNSEEMEDFLKSFGQGLTSEQMEALQKMPTEALKGIADGGFYFIKEEEWIIDTHKHITKEIRDLLLENISSARSFFLTMTGFSLTITGLVVSVLSSGSKVFRNDLFVYLGLASFIFCVFASILYLLNRFSKENNNLTERMKIQRSFLSDLRKLLNTHVDEHKLPQEYIEAKKGVVSKYEEIEREFNTRIEDKSKILPRMPMIITYSFLAGLIFIGLSFVDEGFYLGMVREILN